MESDKENLVQAVVIADTFNNNFHPICSDMPLGLLPVVGVPLINLVFEGLAQGGVDELILFCCKDAQRFKDHISTCIENKAPWSLTMDVRVMMSETCQTMGDVMRELDASGLLRGHFILAGINTITNLPFASLLDQHKAICKKDRNTAMSLIYKKVAWGHKLICPNQAVLLATDVHSKKILMHKICKSGPESKSISVPLDLMLSHSEVQFHHNLINTNISFCSPSVLPLFSDNFDFQTRDDFVNGILINEEILSSSLYYLPLKGNEYAASLTNWKSYQIISRDILHNWAYPLTIDTGVYGKKDKYIYMGEHNYRNKSATLSRNCNVREDVVIGEQTHIEDHAEISKSIIGDKCIIGKNVSITGSHLLSGVIVKDNCIIEDSYIGENCVIESNVSIKDGVIIAPNITIKSKSNLAGTIIQDQESKSDRDAIKSTSDSTGWDNESAKSDEDDGFVGFNKVWSDSESYYSSASSEDLSVSETPEQEDTNIFLQEVIDSLARGYEEKLKCDYLILEINSSRYAYNIQLHEVNFYVVRALLSMPSLAGGKNTLVAVKDILKFFKPVLDNYIKTKPAIMDCLRAVEESCMKCSWLDGRAGQIIHLLYEADIADEDSLTEWYEDLKEQESPLATETSLGKFFDWLQEASEESDN